MIILVADDDRRVRDHVSNVLTEAGHTALTVKSGFEAIKVAEQARPSVVLLDGLMPEMHGFEIARYIRRLSKDYHPLIVLMTAVYKTNKYQSEAKLKYGVDEYLVKPLDTKKLLSLLSVGAPASKAPSLPVSLSA